MKKNIYEIAKNNYVIILFLSIIVFSLAYIFSHDHKSLDGLDEEANKIEMPEELRREVVPVMTPEVEELMNYIIPLEDKFTSYQSIFDKEKVTIDDLNTGDKLYIAYKYLEKTVDFKIYTKAASYDTFKEYLSNYNQYGPYYINTYITKEHLNEAVKKIFNESLTSYVDFSGAMCYLKDDNYVCSNNVYPLNDKTHIEFVRAIKDDYSIDIIVKYSYDKYKYFNSDEEGESLYKVSFIKDGDKYYFSYSELYEEN